MLTGNFPGKREYNYILLKQSFDAFGFPVQIQWNYAKPPLSIFGSPKILNSTDMVNANQVSVFYNNVEIVSAFALKSKMGKILVRNKYITEAQQNQVKTAFSYAGITLKKPSLGLAVAASVAHFVILALLIAFGFLIGDFMGMIYFWVAFLGLITILIGLMLILFEIEKAGIIIFFIGMILTVPSGLLQFPLISYLTDINKEKKPRMIGYQ